jgi:uncharacterized protein
MTLYDAAAKLVEGSLTDELREAWIDGTLRFQHCAECGHVRYPPSPRCPECLAPGGEWRPDAGTGTVWSFCVYHHLYHRAFTGELPYRVALVELDSGPRLISNLVDVDDVRIGMRVTARVVEVRPGFPLVYFGPDPGGDPA